MKYLHWTFYLCLVFITGLGSGFKATADGGNGQGDGGTPDGELHLTQSDLWEISTKEYQAGEMASLFQDPKTRTEALQMCLLGLLQVYGGALRHTGTGKAAAIDESFNTLLNDYFRMRADLSVHRLARAYMLMHDKIGVEAKQYERSNTAGWTEKDKLEASREMARHMGKLLAQSEDPKYENAATFYAAVLGDDSYLSGDLNAMGDGETTGKTDGLKLMAQEFRELFPQDKFIPNDDDFRLLSFINDTAKKKWGKVGFFNKLVYSMSLAYRKDAECTGNSQCKEGEWDVKGSLKAIEEHQKALEKALALKLKEIQTWLVNRGEDFQCKNAGITNAHMVEFVQNQSTMCNSFQHLPFPDGKGSLLGYNIQEAVNGLTWLASNGNGGKGSREQEKDQAKYLEGPNYWVQTGRSMQEYQAGLGLAALEFDYQQLQHKAKISVNGEAPGEHKYSCKAADNRSLNCQVDVTTVSIGLLDKNAYPISIIAEGTYGTGDPKLKFTPSSALEFNWPFAVALELTGEKQDDGKIKLQATPTAGQGTQLPANGDCQWKLDDVIIAGATGLAPLLEASVGKQQPKYTCEYGFVKGSNFVVLASGTKSFDLADHSLHVALKQSAPTVDGKVQVTLEITQDGVKIPDNTPGLAINWEPAGEDCAPKSLSCRMYVQQDLPFVVKATVTKDGQSGEGTTEIPALIKPAELAISIEPSIKGSNVELEATLSGASVAEATIEWYKLPPAKENDPDDKKEDEEELVDPDGLSLSSESTSGTAQVDVQELSLSSTSTSGTTQASLPTADSPAEIPDLSLSSASTSGAQTSDPSAAKTPTKLSCTGETCTVPREDKDYKVYAIAKKADQEAESNQANIPAKSKVTIEDPEEKDGEDDEQEAKPKAKTPQYQPVPPTQIQPPVKRRLDPGNTHGQW